MALAQPNTQAQMLGLKPKILVPKILASQTSGLTQVHIKGPSDDGLDGSLDDGLDGSLGDNLDNGLDGSLDDGLDALIRRHTARRPDEKKKIKTTGSNLAKIMREYDRFLIRLEKNERSDTDRDFNFSDIKKRLKAVLRPADIYAFSQAISLMDYSKVDGIIAHENDIRPSKFINLLIQNSYNAGYNEFVLNLSEIGERCWDLMKFLGSGLHGRKNKMLQLTLKGVKRIDYCTSNVVYCSVTIDGMANSRVGYGAKHSTFTINGYVDSCGACAEESHFTVNGDTNSEFGYGVKMSYFIINGNVNHNAMSYAEDSCFIVNGTLSNKNDSLRDNKRCTFKTQNTETLGKLLEYVQTGSKNKIYFIHPNGREELMRAG